MLSRRPVYVGPRLKNALRWKRKIPVSEWARQNHYLPETAAVKGRWGTVSVPFADMFIDWYNKKNLQEIGYLAASQISKTESVLALINYCIDRDPSAMTLFFPNDKLAEFNASEKVIPAIRRCPANAESVEKKLSEVNRKEKMLLVRFLGGFLKIAGAETSRNRKSVNSKVTFIDEASEVNPEAISEIIERGKTYARFGRKLYLTSTITHDDIAPDGLPVDPMLRFYETAECAVHWEAKCRYCDEYHELEIENVVYPSRGEFDGSEAAYYAFAARNARYVCPHCQMKWSDQDRYHAIENGRKKVIRGDEDAAYSICLRINSLNSVFLPLSIVVQKLLEAEGNPELEQKFHHGWLARRYEHKIEKRNEEEIFALATTIEKGVVPRDTIALTLTVDVQKDHFWTMVVAHRPNKTRHIVDWGRAETWLAIENMMHAEYIDEEGEPWAIDLTGIDYGYSQGGTVQDFLQLHRAEAIPLKGGNNPNGRIYQTTTIEVDYDGKPIKGGITLYVTNSSHYKSQINAQIQRRIETGAEENVITIPKVEYIDGGQVRPDFLDLAKQLTSENYYTEKESSPNKKTGWQKVSKHADNHLWDCLYMSAVMSDIMKIEYMRQTGATAPTNAPAAPVSVVDRY